MIYELMNSEDFKDLNTSFIVGLELADEFIADVYDNEPENLFYEYTDQDIEDTLNDNEFFVCSRNAYEDGDVEYFLEPLIRDNGGQYYLESDVIVIEDDLVDVVDFDKLEGLILTISIEEDLEECEEDVFDEIAHDFFYNLEEDECPHCKLATLLECVYQDGREDLLEEINELV